MAIRQRDYILRMLEALADAIARAAGARQGGRLDEAEQLVRETADGIFGPVYGMVEQLDALGAARVLGDPSKVLAYAALTAEQAAIDDVRARRPAYRRALELYLEAVEMGAPLDDRTRAAVLALLSRVNESRLSDRHRKMLERL
ncbi:MAG: hypothetical protein IT372_12800 [Polyangiaceae bacterium]|nr:hypothetical protein [Polyangiaceae bacterium]